MNNSKEERQAISIALNALDLWFETHEKVSTCFGHQYTVNGYQLFDIRILPAWIIIELYMLDRSVQEKDVPREGDKATFSYIRKTGLLECKE